MKNDLWDVIKKYVIREGNMPLKLWQPEDDLPREFQFLSKHIQSVLIVGERGTGKEGMAEDICFNHWHANEECYKPQNCAALDSNLAKAALFGYIKGAFTGAERTTPGLFWKSLTEAQIEEIWVSKTHSGVDIKNLHKEVASSKHVVYFLDELHHLSLENQAALLRLIESHQFAPMGLSKLFVLKGEYEPKIIAAVQPHALNDENKFMPDLRDRFEYMHEINPLRDRPTTIPRLILIRALQEITKNIQDKHEREQIVAQFLSKVMVRWTDLCRMLIYSWPGNVRELVRLVKHAVLINAAESHNGILDFTLNKIGQESNKELKYIFKKMHDDSNCERWGSSSHSLQQRLESGVFLPVWKTERTNKAAAFSTAQIDELRKCLDEHNRLRFQPDYGRIVDFICARVNYALKIGPMQGSTDKNEFDLKIRKEVNEMYEKLAEAAKQGKIKISGRFDTNVILEGMNDYYETFKKDCSQDKDGNAKDSSNRFDDDYFVDAAVNSCLRDIEAAPHDDVPDYKSIVKQLFVYIDKHTSGASVNYDSIVDVLLKYVRQHHDNILPKCSEIIKELNRRITMEKENKNAGIYHDILRSVKSYVKSASSYLSNVEMQITRYIYSHLFRCIKDIDQQHAKQVLGIMQNRQTSNVSSNELMLMPQKLFDFHADISKETRNMLTKYVQEQRHEYAGEMAKYVQEKRLKNEAHEQVLRERYIALEKGAVEVKKEKPDKEKLLEILARLDNNITHVAKEIRCSKVSVYRYLDEYEIDIPGRPRKKNKKK